MKSETAANDEDFLQDARVLADFSNLVTQEDADYFRHNHRGFLPDGLWNTLSLTIEDAASGKKALPSWNTLQQQLLRTWRTGFPLNSSVSLITSLERVTKLSQALEDVASQAAKTNDMESLSKTKLPQPEYWPFQRAVMFMAVESWRARFCSACGKSFAAAKAKQGLCSDKCREDAEKRRKNAWWSRSGRTQRKSKRKDQIRRDGKTKQSKENQ
jgi:predicted nucleic acid-binding Zn ribbon protein